MPIPESTLYLRALQIAVKHPAGDKHPLRVAARFVEIDHKIVALLHDSLEDNYATVGELGEQFPQHYVQDVIILTRAKNEQYFKYIARILDSRSDRAIAVKIADLAENVSRCEASSDPKHKSLLKKYIKALDYLGRKK